MSSFRFTCVLSLLTAALLAHDAAAQDWTITTADFRTRPALLHGLSRDGVRYTAPGSGDEHVIPLDQFVAAQRATSDSSVSISAAAKFTLVLRNGDRLAGEPAHVANERLTWRSVVLGELPIPLQQLAALARGGEVSAPTEPPKQDVVALANGDSVAGIVADCTADKISVQTDAGVTDVPMASVSKVLFAAVGGARTTTAAPGYRVKLTDGSAIRSAHATFTGDQLTITLDGKPPRKISLRLSDVISIEQLNGPISWLSSRTPSESVQVPYFGGASTWPARFDAAVDGGPLRFGSQTFDHGIGVHAYSRLVLAVDPGWVAFRTQYAIDSRRDASRPLADVTVRVKLDDRVVHEQSHVRAGALSPVVSVDLNGAKTLTLEVDYGDGGDTQDHLNWIEPALLRVRPTAGASPTAEPSTVTTTP